MTNRTATLSPRPDLAELIVSRIPAAQPDIAPSREQLAEVAASIASTFLPEQIVLFGSRAYGTPNPDSDIDLMVVMETPLSPPEQAARIHQAITFKPSFPLDVLVRRPDQIRAGLREGDFFVLDVMRRGPVLYEAGDASLDAGINERIPRIEIWG